MWKKLKALSLIKQQPDKVVLVVKNLPANAGDVRDAGSIPGSGRSPREGNGNPLQCSCLGNPTDRGAWQAILHGVTRVGRDLVNKQQLKKI